ncbi:hypothetical protein MY3957_007446 [Beauveria namnaoensis]
MVRSQKCQGWHFGSWLHRSSVYVAAIVLSPHQKWKYFDVAWEDHPEWVESGKAAVEALWKTRYEPVTKPAESQAHALVDKPPVKNSFLTWEDEREDLELPAQFDEYQNYISAPRIKVKDVRKWWLEDTQQMLYPNLSKMALDLLSISAMSAEPERLFSDTKLTLQDRRNRLGIGIIEAIECIKSWSRSHKVAWVDDVGLTLDTSVTGEEEKEGFASKVDNTKAMNRLSGVAFNPAGRWSISTDTLYPPQLQKNP